MLQPYCNCTWEASAMSFNHRLQVAGSMNLFLTSRRYLREWNNKKLYGHMKLWQQITNARTSRNKNDHPALWPMCGFEYQKYIVDGKATLTGPSWDLLPCRWPYGDGDARARRPPERAEHHPARWGPAEVAEWRGEQKTGNSWKLASEEFAWTSACWVVSRHDLTCLFETTLAHNLIPLGERSLNPGGCSPKHSRRWCPAVKTQGWLCRTWPIAWGKRGIF